jgi:hypothetical protein
LRGIHRGNEPVKLGLSSGSPERAAAGLNFLRIDFQRTLSGNIHQKRLEFLQGTRTLYGPVDAWNVALDQVAETELPPEAVILTCERLAVAQAGTGNDSQQIELEATGNAHVQGSAFSAMAGRISYARAKDQLILEGDGRSKATLAYQQQAGQPHSTVTADKVLYSLSTRQFQLTGWDAGDLHGVGPLRGARAPLGDRR